MSIRARGSIFNIICRPARGEGSKQINYTSILFMLGRRVNDNKVKWFLNNSKIH